MAIKYRTTPARKAVVEIFTNSKSPLSASSILANLTKKNISVNKTTVYREINFLLENGFIRKLYINSDKTYFEWADVLHHHHFVCNNCGSIEDIILENDIGSEEKRLETEKGFKITKHSLEFFGICINCL